LASVAETRVTLGARVAISPPQWSTLVNQEDSRKKSGKQGLTGGTYPVLDLIRALNHSCLQSGEHIHTSSLQGYDKSVLHGVFI